MLRDERVPVSVRAVGAEPSRGRSLRERGVGRKVALIAPREVSRSLVERCLSPLHRTRARLSSRGAMKATFDLFPALEKRLRGCHRGLAFQNSELAERDAELDENTASPGLFISRAALVPVAEKPDTSAFRLIKNRFHESSRLRPIGNCEVPDPRREHGPSCSTPPLCESPGRVSPPTFVTPVRRLETPRHAGVATLAKSVGFPRVPPTLLASVATK